MSNNNMSKFELWKHKIAHYFGWFTGDVETWWEGEDLMVGFKCSKCGLISGIHKSPNF